ncbi:MAG: stage II sporulation protein P [Clostridia bacterium]|nr:stage II sporulation protein P [Clostridia bacterium]
MAIVVLFLGMIEGKSGFLSSLSAGLMRLEFMDLSGKEKPKEKNEELSDDETKDVWYPVEKPLPDIPEEETPKKEPMTFDQLYSFDYAAVPNGALPILPMDLSLSSYGAGYIQNFTGFSPDTEALLYGELRRDPSVEYLSRSDKPSVLILHTHGTESYSPDGAISYVDGAESLRSENLEENVVSVGKVLADALESRGISTIHCTVLHDRVQYKDSYARAEETIRDYLAEYPSIKLVIDLHRDAVIKSTGEMIRPVTLNEKGEATAQVMCVVGSSWNGEKNERWEGNLALALKFRAALNEKTQNLCRPPYLRGATYNQELAPYSLLIEIGACGNSLLEAKRAALLIADALSELIPKL